MLSENSTRLGDARVALDGAVCEVDRAMTTRAGNRILVLLILILCTYWAVKRSVWMREKPKSIFHSCPMEWRGPMGSLQSYIWVCTETGKKKGEVYRSDEGWRAYTAGETYDTIEKAKVAEEKTWW